MRRTFDEFLAFLMQADTITLAIAFVLGVAFTALIGAIVGDLVTPVIGAIFGGRGKFGDLSFTIHGSVFKYGNLLDAAITFLTVAAAAFFVVLKPYQAYSARGALAEANVPLTTDQQLLAEIRNLLAETVSRLSAR